MLPVKRAPENPLLKPNKKNKWQAIATFNPSVIKENNEYHMVFRAISTPQLIHQAELSISSIGYAYSEDGIHFHSIYQLIKPEENWERFGCEDPRITKLDNEYYILYTALSAYPFEAKSIRVGMAVSPDLKKITEKYLVTPFNAKAMGLFPEKINGKMTVILTAHTDLPPAKIAIAQVENKSELHSPYFWNRWYQKLDEQVIPLMRNPNDHIEVGATPLKTEQGWLLIYAYIKNYFSGTPTFGIEAALLDLQDPKRLIGRTETPLLTPCTQYEKDGFVPNVIFPSGALIHQKNLYIYYGAADTTCCLAMTPLHDLLKALTLKKEIQFINPKKSLSLFQRYKNNPILSPRPEFAWERKSVFNPGAIYLDQQVHLIYRALSDDYTSTMGYANSYDGVTINQRSQIPIYTPNRSFERKLLPDGYSGCEDPRLTQIEDKIYMCYTAFDGYTPRVALTAISVENFLKQQWDWEIPKVITPPHIHDKDACLLAEQIQNHYVIFHRAENHMRINFTKSLDFKPSELLGHGGYLIKPKKKYWNRQKFGIAAPPLKTRKGWLLIFHRAGIKESIYKIEALLLALEDPRQVIAETHSSLLEPEMPYEKVGLVNQVVFPCGAVLINGIIYLYYGAADSCIGVAKIPLETIWKKFDI